MIFEITDCNKRCWECSENCEMKKMFLLPESVFNNFIIESLKASMGMYIAKGGNPKIATDELQKTAVALSISRKKFLENQ